MNTVIAIAEYKAQRRWQRWAVHIQDAHESARRMRQARDELAAALRIVRRRSPEGRAQAWGMLDDAYSTGKWECPPVKLEVVQ